MDRISSFSFFASGWRAALPAAFRIWRRRAATRRSLRDLEPWQLADIGLAERDRRREAEKWFWVR